VYLSVRKYSFCIYKYKEQSDKNSVFFKINSAKGGVIIMRKHRFFAFAILISLVFGTLVTGNLAFGQSSMDPRFVGGWEGTMIYFHPQDPETIIGNEPIYLSLGSDGSAVGNLIVYDYFDGIPFVLALYDLYGDFFTDNNIFEAILIEKRRDLSWTPEHLFSLYMIGELSSDGKRIKGSFVENETFEGVFEITKINEVPTIGILTGKVTDAAYVGLKGARLTPEGKAPYYQPTTYTSDKGEYLFCLPMGSYKVKVSKDGYQSQERKVDITTANQTKEENFELNRPPSCAIVAPSNGATISGTYRVKVSASDTDGSIAKVELRIDSGSPIDITAKFDGGYYYYDWNTTTVPNSNHTLYAKAKDNKGAEVNAPSVSVVVKVEGTVPLYRLYNGWEHFYTTSGSERDSAIQIAGYWSEGIACYVFASPLEGTIPFYRLYKNGCDHFYTTSASEIDSATRVGYGYEGIACYVFASPVERTVPLYRLFNGWEHFYTTSASERDSATRVGYGYEGLACYVFASPAAAPSIPNVTTEFPVEKLTYSKDTPSVSQLGQNYPNPFNPETWIPYQLSEGGDVTIRIYDSRGRLIKNLDLGHQPPGFYLNKEKAAYWDGRNDSGERVASGVYFYKIEAGKFTATRKMIIMK
jgi:hypothetical protein